MKLIIDYGGFGEVYEFKGATEKQMIELRKKIISSFTNNEPLFKDLEVKIRNCNSVEDLLKNE